MKFLARLKAIICWPFAALLALLMLLVFFVSVIIYSLLYTLWLAVFPAKPLWRYWVRPCGWLCLKSLGQKIVVKGKIPSEQNGPYLYLSNHQSFLDAFLVAYAMPHHITALGAAKYFKLPIWGWMMKAHGVVPVDHANHNRAVAAVSQGEETIKNGFSLVIFPEGERSRTGKLQKFKKGAFHLARNTGVTIIPFTIEGTFQSWPRGSLLVQPGTITVTFLEPIPAERYMFFNDVGELKDLVENRIAQALNQ